MNSITKHSTAYKIYMVLITSILLGFYAYQQPLNCLLGKIRQAGVISISVSSLCKNWNIAVAAVKPTLIMWIAILAAWICLVMIGKIKNGRFAEILFGRITLTDGFLKTLFYVGMSIEMVWSAFFYATFSMPFATILVFIAMQCFAVKIILENHTRNEWIIIGCLVALGVVCELYTTRGFVLRTVLIILASDGIDKRKVMKCYLVVNILAFVVIAALSRLGIAGNWLEYDAFRSADDTQNRYVFGFNSPNTTHYVLIRLVLVAMYIWWDKVKLWHIVAIFLANYGLYIFTDSRTGFLVGFVTCILAVFFKYFKRVRDWKIWSYLAIFMILVLAVFSLHFLRWNFYQYDTTHECPTYVYKVNDVMVGRIHQALKFTQDIEVSPFGTRQSGVYCDMGYIKLFLQEGFIFFFVYIGMLVKLIISQHRNKDYMGYIIVVAVSLRMFMESSFVPFVFQNIIWLLMIGNWRMKETVNEF